MAQDLHPFSRQLIHWYSRVKRDLPWRETTDPYKIWLSEIILQQTRVDQGLPYYLRFVERYATVQELANASEQEVLKLWEGLGYYSRARNLLATARQVSAELGGVFPGNYAGLIRLKGIGPYTAAAIASIAYGEAKPVVDGNVFRFAARYFGIDDDIADARTRKVFEAQLAEVIPAQNPGIFNQAVMEYGATVCKPAPLCSDCNFSSSCHALQTETVDLLPVKKRKTAVQDRYIHYLVFDDGRGTLMRSRRSSIWHGLFEFHNLEMEQPNLEQLPITLEGILPGTVLPAPDYHTRHLLTHRRLWVSFYRIPVGPEVVLQLAKDLDLHYFSWKEVLNLPKPKVIVNYLHKSVINY